MNKLFGLFLLALAFLAPGTADAACSGGNCFWIGGTGTLDNATDQAHWATTSGGGTCSCVPAATDNVTFDANSGTGTVTVSVGGAGSTWTIASITASNFNGTLDFAGGNNNSVTMTGSFTNASSVVRTLNLGTGTFTLSGGGSLWNIITGTNLTLSGASSTIAFTGTGTGQRRFFGGGKTYGTVTVASSTTGSFSLSGSGATIGTFTPAAPNKIYFVASVTVTITNFSNFTCNSTNQCVVSSDDTANNNAATVSSANNWTCTYCSVNQMTFSGGGTFTGTNSFNTGNNTGITITPPSGGGGGGRIIGG